MSLRKTFVAALFALFTLASAGAVADSTVTLAEYRQKLAELEQKLERLNDSPEEAAAIVAALPDNLPVNTGAGEITVNFQSFKDDVAAFARGDAQKRQELLRHVQDYVHSLAREAKSYDETPAEIGAAERNLKQILARREFRKVHGPDAGDRLLARIYYWLARLLNRIGRPGQGTFNVIQVLIWLFIGGVVLGLVLWTVSRLVRPDAGPGEREIIPFAPSARSWRSWLTEARESAAQQDWRNAIHLAYWAGISFLESSGAWKPNRARTPREYLRLLSSRNPNHPALSALTRKFEVVWYGRRVAQESDFQETLGQLERLGCR